MVFDVRTLLLINFIVNVLSAGTMAVIWYQYRNRFSGLSFILADLIMSAIGVGLLVIRQNVPEAIAIILGNGLMLVGLFLLFVGLEEFVNQKGPQIQNYFLLLFYFVSVTYFTVIQNNLWYRELILAGMIVLLDLQICWLLFQRTTPVLRPATRILGLVMGCHLVFSFIILALEIIFPFDTNNFFSVGFVGEIIVTTYLLLNIWIIIALVMMVTRRLLGEVMAQEEKFTKAFHSAPYALILTKMSDGIIFEANEGFTKITGYTLGEVIGKSTRDLSFWARDEDRNAIINRVSGETAEGVEIQFRQKSGELKTGLLSAETIMIHEEACILASISDITERKASEAAIRQANKKLNLLSSITRHDINNQLTVLMGFLSILETKQTDPGNKDYFEKAETAAEQISTMISFTKQYEEIGINAPAWHNCHVLIDNAAKEVPLGNVRVENNIPAGTEIFADPLIVKVCYNLIDNALRHGGEITTIRFSVEACHSGHILICSDDGAGVSLKEKEKIFERGFGKNTGMGLFLAREILSITGITIRETGEPGKGARFEITVPKEMYR
ncbi:MAG: PAS domain-containing sensor histidine kinase [Methanomicrobiales archaeon]